MVPNVLVAYCYFNLGQSATVTNERAVLCATVVRHFHDSKHVLYAFLKFQPKPQRFHN